MNRSRRLASALGSLLLTFALAHCGSSSATDDPGGKGAETEPAQDGGSKAASGPTSSDGGSGSHPDAGSSSDSGGADSSSGGDPTIDTGADNPALQDPARPSAPYECQGVTLTAATFVPYVAQGTSGFTADTRKNGDWQEWGLGLIKIQKTCTGATGCSAWQEAPGRADWEEFNSEMVRVGLRVAGNGVGYVINPLWQLQGNFGSVTEERKKVATTIDLQLRLRLLNTSIAAVADVRQRMRIIATTQSDGSMCVSAAGPVVHEAAADGTTTDWFWVGSATSPVSLRSPTPDPALASYQCTGAPSTDAQIAAIFSSGQAELDFAGASSATQFEHSCHPLSGCTPYASTYLGGALVAIAVDGPHFAARLNSEITGPTYAITSGLFSIDASNAGSVRGSCMDRKETRALADDGYGAQDSYINVERRMR